MNNQNKLVLPVVGLAGAVLLVLLAWPTLDAPPGYAIVVGLLAGVALLALLWAHNQRLSLAKAGLVHAETTLNALADAVLQLDPDGRLTYHNQSGEKMLGLNIPAIEGEEDEWRLIDHNSRTSLIDSLLHHSRLNSLARLPAGARLVNRQGIELEVEGHCQPLRDQHGEIRSYLLQLRDVTEEREWIRQQPDLWDRDPVSALPGRCFVENRINRALEHRRAGDLPLSYLYLPAQGIRTVYAESGDQAGDTLVRQLTTLLRAHVRDTDIVGRMDDESFGILLTFCPAEISHRIGQEILAALGRFEFEWEGRKHTVRVSLGHVDAPPFQGSLDELLATASASSRANQP